MSNWREQLSEDSESEAILALATEYYHYPVLLLVIGFAFWNRIRNWGNFVIDGEVIVRANDPWYHLRSTEYTVRNFPSTMPFDPWTYFPFGNFVSQFGTVFDQTIALVALIAGLGDPSQYTTRFIFMVSPAFWALLVCIPAYFIGRRVGGRFGGIISVGFVAFAPDRLLQSTVVGSVDHNPAEVLFMSLGVLGVMVALRVAAREKPVYELLVAREFDALRAPIGWSMLGGIGIGLYIWTWPPGVLLYGILAVFFVIHLSIEHVLGRSPEHPAFVGAIALTTASVMQLSTVRTLGIDSAGRTLLQPGLGLAVAAGIVFLAWLSREVESRGFSRYAYPAVVAGSIAVSVGLFALLLPNIFDFFIGQVDRVLGFITPTEATAGTVGEVTPAERSDFEDWYKFANYTAILGGAALLGRAALSEESTGEELLVVVWSGFLVAATLTQIRFGYYLTLPIGALNAGLVGIIMGLMGSDSDSGVRRLETYQVLTIFAVVLVMFAPMFAAFPLVDGDSERTVMDTADGSSFAGGIVGWSDGLDWMDENTPEEGQYANPDGEQMDLYGQYSFTDDFEYRDGTYGVISWWDYGHWITGKAERIPTANPFQQGTGTAARFLLAQDEQTAQDVLSEVDESEAAKTRYAMIDWKMIETESARPISGKFFAPPTFHPNFSRSDFYTRLARVGDRGQFSTLSMVQKQPYYDSMVARLYHYHGSSQGVSVPQLGVPVVQWQGSERELQGSAVTFLEAPVEGQAVQFFDNVSAARQFVENNPSAKIGGIGAIPEERVPALENFRLVNMGEVDSLGRNRAAITANQNGLPITPLRRSTQRAVFGGSGLGMEIARAVTGNQSMSRQEFAQLGQQTRQQVRAIAEQRVLFPNTPSWTKTFERVPGATIQGENAPANTQVTLEVPMQPENGQEFTYTQRTQTGENGEFNTTVPYSTEGYEELGVDEGYTNVSVRANDTYTIRTGLTQTENGSLAQYVATANVTEAQVVGEDASPVEVTLEEQTFNFGGGGSGDQGSGDGSGDQGAEDGSGDQGAEDGSSQGSDGQGDIGEPGLGPILRDSSGPAVKRFQPIAVPQ